MMRMNFSCHLIEKEALLMFVIVFLFFHVVHVELSSICGQPTIEPIVIKSRIVGGITARPHSWPWIISLRQSQNSEDPGEAFCVGSLIHEKFVLTAAHCLYHIHPYLLEKNYFLVVAAYFINDTNKNRFTMKSVILHDDYDDESYLNDIALIELDRSVDLTDPHLALICLPDEDDADYPTENQFGYVAGWGQIGENKTYSYTLQQVYLPIISERDEFCQRQISDTLLQFCAGFRQGGKDTCQGDSGGPLMIFDIQTNRWQLVGITSYGYGCARAEYPGVYTRVSMYIEWIDEQLALLSSSASSSSPSSSPSPSAFGFHLLLLFIFVSF